MKANQARRKLHVLSVTNELYIGGDENRLLQFATTIDRDKFDHTIICLKVDNPELDAKFGSLRPRFAEAGIPVEELEKRRASVDFRAGMHRVAGGASILWRTVWKLKQLISERKVDIVSAHVSPAGTVSVLAAAAAGRPRIVTSYYPEPVGGTWEPKWVWWPRRQIELAMADAIVTDSAAKRDEFRRWMLRKNISIPVIPNGAIRPIPRRSRAEVSRSLGLPTEWRGPIIGQLSRIIERKGQLHFIRAIPSVLSRFPSAFFLIVGFPGADSMYPDKVEREIVRLGIEDHTKVVPYPGPVGDVWQLIDIHVHAALEESLPNAILEGMSLGKPAIVTSVGGIREMVEDGITGFVVPPSDSKAIADAILLLLEQPEHAKKLGQAAVRRYNDRYTPEIMTRQLEKLILETCRKHPCRAN